MFHCNSLTSGCKQLSNFMVHISCSYTKIVKHGDDPDMPIQVPHILPGMSWKQEHSGNFTDTRQLQLQQN